MERTYYIYRHIRLDKNEPFYIGRGVVYRDCGPGTRQERAYSKYGRNKIWGRIVAKTPYSVDILYETTDPDEILKKEVEFIKLYGRKDLKTGTLCNLTDGGDGVLNQNIEALRLGVEKRITNGSYERIGKLNSSPVYVYRGDRIFFMKFESRREAAKALKYDLSSIFSSIKNRVAVKGLFFLNDNTRDYLDENEFHFSESINWKR